MTAITADSPIPVPRPLGRRPPKPPPPPEGRLPPPLRPNRLFRRRLKSRHSSSRSGGPSLPGRCGLRSPSRPPSFELLEPPPRPHWGSFSDIAFPSEGQSSLEPAAVAYRIGLRRCRARPGGGFVGGWVLSGRTPRKFSDRASQQVHTGTRPRADRDRFDRITGVAHDSRLAVG